MNAAEMLDNVHLRTIRALDDLPELQWDIPGACGNWTVKEIVAHLTSYELALAEGLKTFLGQPSTRTYISRLLEDGAKFLAPQELGSKPTAATSPPRPSR